MSRIAAAFIGASWLLLGCVPPHSTVRSAGGPGGAGYRSIECTGSHQQCIDKAASICPNGYELATSGGATTVSGGTAGGTGGLGSKYTGHMLVRCNSGPIIWRKVRSGGCAFEVPRDWDETTVDGSTVFHPHSSYDEQVAADSTPFTGTLEAYAAKHFKGAKLEDTEVPAGPALFVNKADELNDLRETTVLVLKAGKIYELLCASKLTETISPTCGHVLRSLQIADGD